MAFGLSFGKKSQKTSGVETIDQTQVKNETQNTSGSTNTSASTSSTGSTSQTGTSNQTTAQQENTSTQGSQQTSQSSNLFSSQILSQLESVVGGLFSGAGSSGSVVTDAVESLTKFDADQYVDSSVKAAQASTASSLDEALGGLSDQIGSGLGNNSMGALLANRAAGDAAANVEGVRANATAQAQEILRGNQTAAVSASQSQNSLLTSLLDALKGGSATTTGTAATSETGTSSTTGSQSGTTTQAGTSTEATTSQQTVLEQLQQILSGVTEIDGTTTSKGKTSSVGFGLSL